MICKTVDAVMSGLLFFFIGLLCASIVISGCDTVGPRYPRVEPAKIDGRRCVVDESGAVICIVEDVDGVLRHVADVTHRREPKPQEPRRPRIGEDNIGDTEKK